MITFNWQIQQLERLTSDGFVVAAHYIVNAIDGEYQTSTYGAINYTQTEGKIHIPYVNLTQEIVVGWVQEALGKDTVEASLQGQIDALKNPVQESGLPWVTA